MAAKVQFNPSTLKTSYTAATNKVQMVKLYGYGNDCEYCNAGETPIRINANFSGLTNCLTGECISFGGGPNDFWIGISGLAALVNAATFTLIQTAAACVWEREFDISPAWEWIQNWSSEDPWEECIELLETYSFDKMTITVTKGAGGNVTIAATLSCSTFGEGISCQFFNYSQVPGYLSDCIRMSGNNSYTCEDLVQHCALGTPSGGSITITEVP